MATGNLVRDMEVTFLANGTALGKNTLAVKDEFKKDTTHFFNITAFGKTAETMGNFLHKGSKILIEGQLSQSTYEKNGEKRSSTDVIVNRFEFLDSKKDSGTSYNKPEPKNDTSMYNADPFDKSGTPIDISDSDLPF